MFNVVHPDDAITQPGALLHHPSAHTLKHLKPTKCVINIIDGCEIGYMESELVAEEEDDLTFSPGDDIGGLTNPLLFSGEILPVSVYKILISY